VLAEPGATQFDLRWRMFGVPVRVHPFFWLIALVLGYNVYHFDLILLGLWVGCVFFSILLHEFGHVWMGQAFGSHGHIILWGMGGLAVGSNSLFHRWQRILVSFAGPGIELAFFALVWVGWRFAGHHVPVEGVGFYLREVYWMLFAINLFWPLVNLLPLWPLDGGQITREVCQGVSARKGTAVSLWISAIVSGVLALLLFISMNVPRDSLLDRVIRRVPLDPFFLAIFFAIFCIYSVLYLQQLSRQQHYWGGDDLPWER
jgi:stage IV sporulation protein FB